MKPILKTIALAILILWSCGENDNEIKGDYKTNEGPGSSLSETIHYDFNEDSIDDFTIGYRGFIIDGNNFSGEERYGYIKPLEDNFLFHNQNDNNLSLQLNDTIYNQKNQSFLWEDKKIDLIKISGSTIKESFWEDEWSILSDLDQDHYYMGVKIKNDNNSSVGWLKLQFDTSNGKIEIINKKITDKDFIVIDE